MKKFYLIISIFLFIVSNNAKSLSDIEIKKIKNKDIEVIKFQVPDKKLPGKDDVLAQIHFPKNSKIKLPVIIHQHGSTRDGLKFKKWGGKSDELSLGVAKDVLITLPRTDFKKGLKINYNFKNNVQAPIKKGSVMGSLDIISKGEVVHTSDLIALEDIEAKGFFGRLWSSFILWIMSLFGMS